MDDKYDFLKEEIKKPDPYKKWLKKAGEALFAGLIISAVFLLVQLFVYPGLSRLTNGNEGTEISLQSGAGGSDTAETSVASAVVSSEVLQEAAGSSSVVKETDQKESVTEESQVKEEETKAEAEKEDEKNTETNTVSVRETMLAMSSDVVELTKTAKKSMVTVIGITEDKDWFNQTYENQGQLSGLIIAKEKQTYYILTEYRVVKDVNRIMVTFCDGATADARFVRRDPATNLAVIRVDTAGMSKETIKQICPADIEHYTAISQGETVIAMGSPMGYSDSIASGMVTSIGNTLNVTDNAYNLICTDIPASSEGSGILLDLNGNVVGFMTQKLADTKEIGLMMCLPVSEILKQVENLCNDKESVYLGVEGQEVTQSVSDGTGIPKGVYVNAVKKDSPAMVVGMQAGDVIYKIDDNSVYTLKALHSVLESEGIGKKVTVCAMRQGSEGYVEMKFEVEIEGK